MLNQTRVFISLTVLLAFLGSSIQVPVYAQDFSINQLPVPGTMVSVSPSFEPALIKGLTVHQDNPFLFDFIVDPGDGYSGHSERSEESQKEELKAQADRMIKYFFAALTIPDKDIWVNLSPYEKDRMIPMSLGQTAMGRDLLAQDYMLKQLTASLIYPQRALGKTFWDTVYAKAKAMYGTTEIPVNTFNKVWIVPQKVGIYEHGQTAFIVDGHLKVMLEEDYLSMTKHNALENLSSPNASVGDPVKAHTLASQIIKQIILPEIEKEVNDGKNFATLRQIFYAQALAVWFKRNLKQALLNQVYANKGTVKGIDQNDAATNEAIYHQYLKAYKKGVFNYIKEDIDPVTQETLPRKYFSGGWDGKHLDAAMYAVSSLPIGYASQASGFIDVKAVTLFDHAQAADLAKKADAAMFSDEDELFMKQAFRTDDTDHDLEHMIEISINMSDISRSIIMPALKNYDKPLLGALTRQSLDRFLEKFISISSENGKHNAEQAFDDLKKAAEKIKTRSGLFAYFLEVFHQKYPDEVKQEVKQVIAQYVHQLKKDAEHAAFLLELGDWVTPEEQKSLQGKQETVSRHSYDAVLVLAALRGLQDTVRRNSSFERRSGYVVIRGIRRQTNFEDATKDIVIDMANEFLFSKGFPNEKGVNSYGSIYIKYDGIFANSTKRLAALKQELEYWLDLKETKLLHDIGNSSNAAMNAGSLQKYLQTRINSFNFMIGKIQRTIDSKYSQSARVWKYRGTKAAEKAAAQEAIDRLVAEGQGFKTTAQDLRNHLIAIKDIQKYLKTVPSNITGEELITSVQNAFGVNSEVTKIFYSELKEFEGKPDAAMTQPSRRKLLLDRETASNFFTLRYYLNELAQKPKNSQVREEVLVNLRSLNMRLAHLLAGRLGDKRTRVTNKVWEMVDQIEKPFEKYVPVNLPDAIETIQILEGKGLSEEEAKDLPDFESRLKYVKQTGLGEIREVSPNEIYSQSLVVTGSGKKITLNKAKELVRSGQGKLFLDYSFNRSPMFVRLDAAMAVDRAALTKVEVEPGGIDLSQQDAALQVTKDANGGVKVNVDQALIARIEREGMPEVDPVIINMQPADARAIFGVEATIKTPLISPA